MKGDLEYAGHTHKDDRRSPVVSGLGVIAITGLLITITTAGIIFGVHLMNKIDSQSEHLMNTINSQSQQINSQSAEIVQLKVRTVIVFYMMLSLDKMMRENSTSCHFTDMTTSRNRSTASLQGVTHLR